MDNFRLVALLAVTFGLGGLFGTFGGGLNRRRGPSLKGLSSADPHGIMSLFDIADDSLSDVSSITLGFHDGATKAAASMKPLRVAGYERSSMTWEDEETDEDDPEESVTFRTITFALDNDDDDASSEYHSVQLLHWHDAATEQDNLMVSLHQDKVYSSSLDDNDGDGDGFPADGRRLKSIWNKFKDAMKDVKNLKNEVSDLKNKLAHDANKITSLDRTITSKVNEISNLKSTITSKVNEIAAKTREISDLKGTIDSKLSEIANQATKIATQASEITDKAAEITNLKSIERRLNGALDTAKSAADAATRQIEQQATELASKTTQIAEQVGIIDELNNVINTAEGVAGKAAAAADAAANQIKQLNNQIAEKTQELATLKGIVDELNDTLKSAQNNAASALKKVETLTAVVASKARKITELEGEISNLANKMKETARKAATDAAAAAEDAANEVERVTVKAANDVANAAEEAAAKVDEFVMKNIVGPIVDDVNQAEKDIQKILDISNTLAEATVKQIKNLDILPAGGEEVANFMAKQLLDFMASDFCVPYDCIADQFGIDIAEIELYASDNLKVSTALDPSTCVTVTNVGFDPSKLTKFIDLFKDLVPWDKLFNKVKVFVQKRMDDIDVIVEDIDQLLKDIKGIADDFGKELEINRGRRLLLRNDNNETQVMTIEELSVHAYGIGLAHFHELYGEEVERIFQERNLRENAADYIAITSFAMEFEASFGQTVTVEAQGRAGFAGSIFDKALHKEMSYPLPYTGGMVQIKATGSMEASMPYVVSAEGAGVITFGYDLGATIGIDLITGQVTEPETQADPVLAVNAEVTVSAVMGLHFMAQTSLGLCIGPGGESCITLTVDVKQSSEAGFDALATTEGTALTTMYTDKLEYDDPDSDSCSGDLSLSAGIWAYSEIPSVEVSITSEGMCLNREDILVEFAGGMFVELIKDVCLSIDLPEGIIGDAELPEIADEEDEEDEGEEEIELTDPVDAAANTEGGMLDMFSEEEEQGTDEEEEQGTDAADEALKEALDAEDEAEEELREALVAEHEAEEELNEAQLGGSP